MTKKLRVQLEKFAFDAVPFITCTVLLKLLAYDTTFKVSIYTIRRLSRNKKKLSTKADYVS